MRVSKHFEPKEPRNPLADLVGPVLSGDLAAAQLGIGAAALERMRASGAVLAVPTSGGEMFYPVFQFERVNGQTRVRPAVGSMCIILRAQDPWAVVALVHSPAPELDGACPLLWDMRGGRAAALCDFARRVSAEWM